MGFELSSSTVSTIVVVLAIYSVLIVGMGFYLQWISRNQNANQKMAEFLTGGKALGPLAMAMMTFTALSTSGSAVGGPGTGYAAGFTWSICVWTGMVYGITVPFILGKKMTIMRSRLHATSLISLFRHRYGGSKAYSIFLSLLLVVFLGVQVVAQINGGARVFSIITGDGNYQLGIILFGLITIIYTMSGGVKSIAKVAVLQGILMIVTVIMLYIGVIIHVSDQYGSVEAAMQWLAQHNPSLVSAYTFDPFYNIGLCLIMCWGSFCLPGGMVSGMSYRGSKAIVKVGLITMLCTAVYQFAMSGLGPFVYAMNQELTHVDYTSIYAATTVLPGVFSGLFVAGIASAVQSTVAALCLLATSSIVIDLYKNFISPESSAEKINKLNKFVMIIFGTVCILLALNPVDMVQTLINFASGGLFSALLFPVFLGFYWKKANRSGALFGGILGLITFIVCYSLSTNAATRADWVNVTHNCYPLVPALLVCLITMLLCAKFGKLEEKGRLQVWFSREYNEEWADVSK